MPVHCPHCHTEQANGEHCDGCGALLVPQAGKKRRDLLKSLAALGLLGTVPVILLTMPLLAPKKPPRVQAPLTPSAILKPGLPGMTASSLGRDPGIMAVPFTVTLFSTSAGGHVPVGSHIMVTAFTTLKAEKGASLDLCSRQGQEPPVAFATAEGTLCSAAWTPTLPGRYEFVATASDASRHRAVSHRFSIWADADPAPFPGPSLPASAPPAPALPASVATPPLALAPLPTFRPVSVSPIPLSLPLPPPFPAPRAALRPLPAHSRFPLRTHVLVARFPFFSNADTLAQALRGNGFHAAVREVTVRDGTIRYSVDTGIYPPEEAQKQMQALQHDGYPAFCYTNR